MNLVFKNLKQNIIKELSFESMEEVQGGRFWTGCATAMYTASQTGLVAYSSIFGPWGPLATMVGACVVGGSISSYFS